MLKGPNQAHLCGRSSLRCQSVASALRTPHWELCQPRCPQGTRETCRGLGLRPAQWLQPKQFCFVCFPREFSTWGFLWQRVSTLHVEEVNNYWSKESAFNLFMWHNIITLMLRIIPLLSSRPARTVFHSVTMKCGGRTAGLSPAHKKSLFKAFRSSLSQEDWSPAVWMCWDEVKNKNHWLFTGNLKCVGVSRVSFHFLFFPFNFLSTASVLYLTSHCLPKPLTCGEEQ